MKPWLRFSVLIFLAILFFIVSRKESIQLKWILFQPFGRLEGKVVQMFHPFFIDWIEKQALLKQNEQLKKALTQYHNDLRRVQASLSFQKIPPLLFPLPNGRCLYAPVLFRPIDQYYKSAVLGIGKREGIRKGMPLLREKGLVGIVEKVFSRYAYARLITSPALRIGVYDSALKKVGIMQGRGEKGLEVLFFPTHTEVKKGELFLTSSLSVLFFRGIPVGRVTQITRHKDRATLRIFLTPTVSLDNLHWVCAYSFSALP